MKIAIIGTGYVGLVTGACFAQTGHDITCFDKDQRKLEMLQDGMVPFHEPGLGALIAEGQAGGRLAFRRLPHTERELVDADIVFLTIGTPTGPDGRADLQDLLECATRLSAALTRATLVVVKSTAPVGTCERIEAILNAPSSTTSGARLVVASNPEFLAESSAVSDFQNPARIVIGCNDDDACRVLEGLYAPFDPAGTRIQRMDVRSAEFAKYACNAMLAARLSMINELACIGGQLSVDMHSVCKVLGSDPRIGPRYLRPGPGYGGSCLPKDVRALTAMACDHGEPAYMLHSVEAVNIAQGQRLLDSIRSSLAYALEGRCIALWGLSFKAGTDDLREAPAVALARSLLRAGARVRAYDPVALGAASARLANPRFESCPDPYAACKGADVLVVMTEWQEFKQADFARVARQLTAATVFDCQHLYDAASLARHGLRHLEIGQRPVLAAAHPLPDALQKAL